MTSAHALPDGVPQVLDGAAMRRTLLRLSHELLERHPDIENLTLAGILTRGAPLALRIAQIIVELRGVAPEVLTVDVTAFRDDRPRGVDGGRSPRADSGQVDGRTVVIVDDVLFTGRTVRAAIDALMSQGRPGAVEVLVIVDRGHRELPVRATYVGKNVPTSAGDRVRVQLAETDGIDGAWLVGAVPA